jgi:hypothetical protein
VLKGMVVFKVFIKKSLLFSAPLSLCSNSNDSCPAKCLLPVKKGLDSCSNE